MYVLGIETSCDETSAAIVKDGREILSNVVISSLRFHKKYGGVVPEIASRMQLETINQVVDNAIREARIRLKDIDLVSVTSGPGLLGSLLVGISFAKSIGLSLGIPLLGINHLYGHIYASFLEPKSCGFLAKDPKNFCGSCNSWTFPFVALIISGGHTSLFYLKDFDRIELIGATLDDACGEALDKVAKILGLGYPGGPFIEQLAKKGNPKKIKFSCSGTKKPLDFSFSGIKTAVLYYLRDKGYSKDGTLSAKRYPPPLIRDIASSFQETIIDTLIKKALLACRLKKTNRLIIGGGVTANSRLREKFYQETQEKGLECFFPAKELCVDNAAMIAGLGYRLFKKGYRSDLDLNVNLN